MYDYGALDAQMTKLWWR